ncbi:hypothetical protein Ddye_007167 [Dipteronia dyeriana]|uniref:Peptidase C1A papain C-terminal domain-containing protein n=1 Tax=Dipteronia dyeriana TaxID=168575 RepID=A0AAD9XJK9_9ROSI|nr:hypothetical protein Ddye_007167 [Dipteronia dyeriana]
MAAGLLVMFVLWLQCTNFSDGRSQICNNGCAGGHHILAFRYIFKEAGGVKKADDYPFTGQSNKNCKLSDNDKRFVASVSNYEYIKADENQYAAYLVQHGPIAVSTDMDFDQTYQGGVICKHKKHSSGNITHAVTLVGYEKGTSDRDWIIKNSYGKDWGEDGYFKVCQNVLTYNDWDPKAIYAVAAKKKIDI